MKPSEALHQSKCRAQLVLAHLELRNECRDQREAAAALVVGRTPGFHCPVSEISIDTVRSVMSPCTPIGASVPECSIAFAGLLVRREHDIGTRRLGHAGVLEPGGQRVAERAETGDVG